MLSGFFFKSSLKNNLWEFVVKKGTQLILPYIVWCILRGSFFMLYSVLYKDNSFAVLQIINFIIRGHFWFLRELFISYCIAYIGYKILKKGIIVALLCICFTLFAPLMGNQSFYLPIFFIGILCKEYYTLIRKNITILLIISAIIFGMCLPFWKGIYYGVSLRIFSLRRMEFDFSNFSIGLYRLLTGVTGSIFFFCLFLKFYKKNRILKFFGRFGQYILEMYILQVIIIETILTQIIDFQNVSTWLYSFVITPLFALLVFIVCLIIIKTIQKNRYLNLFLFGRKISSVK
jgi:fucose 4-O-acetylase-like acetyltransferase